MASPEIHNLARQLLILEAARDNPSDDDEVAVRVIGQLQLRLVKLAGVNGFRSLLSRALTLARTESPALDEVHISANGSLEGWNDLSMDQAGEPAGTALLVHLLALLVTFIGESLTLHLMRDAWPDASLNRVDDTTEDKP